MSPGRWLRVALLPLLVLGVQAGAAWGFVRVANAAWGPDAAFDVLAAEATTRWLFAAGGPLSAVLLGWGLYTVHARLRLPAALALTALYLPALLVSGLSTWVLGVLLGWC